ncbi:MAG: hypothetical protein WBF06_14975, partial [Candidatus Acidiferrales bacterium]
MGNWQQVQARIRKAKTSADPTGQLAALYSRTRDAMAAYELAVVQERVGNRDQAVEWFTVAVQRFRRAEWKKKAEDALVRLGAPVPPVPDPATVSTSGASESSQPAEIGSVGAAEPRGDDFSSDTPDPEPTLFGEGDFSVHPEPADAPPATDAAAQAKPADAPG